jgi:transposase-like protein
MSSRLISLEQAMDQIVRQRRSESAWREIVARQEQSGLTVQEFCEREGLKPASLYGWRVRLRQQTIAKRPSPQTSKSTRTEKASEEFIDLGAIGASRGRFEVRLDLGGGVLLQLVRS